MNTESIIRHNPHWTGNLPSIPNLTRDLYPQLVKSLSHHPITYLTGARRLGKSVLFQQLLHHLLNEQKIAPQQILFFSFSPHTKNSELSDLYQYFATEIADPNLPQYLLLDEIQYVEGYENVIKDLYDSVPKLKICLTGSLSLSYKRKMEESLAGRFIPYRLLPLSFSEYLHLSQNPLVSTISAYQQQDNPDLKRTLADQINPTFREFLSHGRYPEQLTLPVELHQSYLTTIIDQSLGQDAFAYFNITNPLLLRATYQYLLAHNGLIINLSQIAPHHSPQTISRYLDILDIMGLTYFVYNSTNPIIKLNASHKAYVNSALYLMLSVHNPATSYGYAVESYFLERFLAQNQVITFYHHRQNEIDFLLPNTKHAYEIKFRSNLDHPSFLLKFAKEHKYEPHLITLNSAGSSPTISHAPAFIL